MENTQENYNLISAEVVADSLNQFGERITTMKLVFPRIILAEFNTHRMFNRNSASSRAIPFKKMLKMVKEQPFIPIGFQEDHSGMQGTTYLNGIEFENAVDNWIIARNGAVKEAEVLHNNNVTKQLCNRLLEPFMYHTVLVTATEWENFFELRCPKYQTPVSQTIEPQRSWKDLTNNHSNEDNITLLEENKDNIIFKLQHNKGAAEIHIMDLAEKMWDAYNESTPKQLKVGQWHIPFGDNINIEKLFEEIGYENPEERELLKTKIAVARCARISYETLGDNPVIDYRKDVELHDTLLAIKHMSPFEHCAVVMEDEEYYSHIKTTSADGFLIEKDIYVDTTFNRKDVGWSRNLKGFKQYREFIE